MIERIKMTEREYNEQFKSLPKVTKLFENETAEKWAAFERRACRTFKLAFRPLAARPFRPAL